MDYKIEQIKKLIEELNCYSEAYYNEGNSEISDWEYDKKYEELKRLEEECNYFLPNSPTQNVGYKVLDESIKIVHPKPLLSADKTKMVSDLVEMAAEAPCIATIKLDGLTTQLYIKNGEIYKAGTRGDGEIGTDVSHLINHYTNLPLKINDAPEDEKSIFNDNLLISGESLITYQDFAVVNKGEYSNPRNLASGSMSLLDATTFSKRRVSFYCFNIDAGLEQYDNLSDCYDYLDKIGIPVVPYWIIPQDITEEQMKNTLEGIREYADDLGLPMDGVIVRYNSRKYGASKGRTAKFYKDMIAYKFENEKVESKLLGIEWNTNRTGLIVPAAIFEPITIGGAVLQRATLNNLSYMERLHLHIGDRILVSRRNEVIPCVEENLDIHPSLDYSNVPDKCPSCGLDSKITTTKTSKVLMCNNEGCPAKVISKLIHFASKPALNIDGVSESILTFLWESGMVNNFKDLYHLDQYKYDIINTDGFGSVSYNNIINSINNSRYVTLDRFIVGLGIPLIGTVGAKALAEYYDYDFSVFYFRGVNHSVDYTTIPDFGIGMSKSLEDYFDKNAEFLKELSEEFVFQKPTKIETKESIFTGKTFCITGTFEIGPRSELQQKIIELGGTFVSSVTKKTDFLVAGQKCGSKLTKANQLGIKIIDEQELNKILQE